VADPMKPPADYEGSGAQQTAFHKRRHRPSQLYCRIDVAGFLSIQVLLLLYMFIINSTMNVHPHGITVNRVQAAHSRPVEAANREAALIVVVTRDGRIFFDTQQVAAEELPEKITSRIQVGSPRTIFINADARVHYRAVAAVLDAVRETKTNQVVFLTERPSRP